MTDPLPCLGHAHLYDALFADEQPTKRTTAQHKAAALCGRCPAPCPEKVTVDSGPRTLVLLEDDWLPAEREGRPLYSGREPWHGTPAGVATYGCWCTRCKHAHAHHGKRRRASLAGQALQVGRDYVPPAQRPAAFARMARELAATGRTLPQIATDLCLSDDTVRALLNPRSAAAA